MTTYPSNLSVTGLHHLLALRSQLQCRVGQYKDGESIDSVEVLANCIFTTSIQALSAAIFHHLLALKITTAMQGRAVQGWGEDRQP